MIQPIGNKILVKPMIQDSVARQMMAAMRSEGQPAYVQGLANEIEAQHAKRGQTGAIVVVETVTPTTGEVIAVGEPFCTECRAPVRSQVTPGDVVVFAKTAGYEISIDRVPHILMTQRDVLLIWRPEQGAACE